MRSDAQQNSASDRIAIVGMSARLPGARNLDTFWANLRAGIESISFFDDRELIAAGVDRRLLDSPDYVKANGVLEGIEEFDAGFFDITPREAELTDPQHRLFLECAWEALEHAGYNSWTFDGRIAVYAGAGPSSYLLHNLLAHPDVAGAESSLQLFLGSNKDFVPTRVSYKLNLKGPSVNVSTACSTSLVALHLACQSLLDYQCDMALAGGVGIQVPQQRGYLYHEGGVVSPDGHCRAFDVSANGTVSGNGVSIVLLKRLEDALADRDTIHAVILGSAINNDGADKVGYTAPSVTGQAEVIAEAIAMAGIDPETINYIEAHGTGTPLGDPIEIAALTEAFRNRTSKTQFCAIGSVKTNVGHLDEAAGITGLIKTVLALKHQLLPPSLHYREANPEIDFANSPFFVNQQLTPWATQATPRRAGISSFGIGGTNAHVIVEEAPPLVPSRDSRPWQLLVLSAKTETALATASQRLAEFLQDNPTINLADAAYTLQRGRKRFDWRRVVLCQNISAAAEALASADPRRNRVCHEPHGQREAVFMFSGQGTQYVNMGRGLYTSEPVFRDQLDECAEILQPELDFDLRRCLYPNEDSHEAAQQLRQTALAQPALFSIEYSLAQLLIRWGVKPAAMIGHSSGEYVAACLAGVLSLRDALVLVAWRGRLMQQLPGGSMLAVSLPHEEVTAALGAELSLAVVNAPAECVVSGNSGAIERFEVELTQRGVTCSRLHTSHAFHSSMMDPIVGPFEELVRQFDLKPPSIPYISNVSGDWIRPDEAMDPGYWSRQLRETVRFSDGIQRIAAESDAALVEIGPGRSLSTAIRCHVQLRQRPWTLASLPHPKDDRPDTACLLQTLGDLWLAGVPIDWSGFYKSEERGRIPLPTYPFERRRYWVEPPRGKPQSQSHRQVETTPRRNLSECFYTPSWRRSTQPARPRNSKLGSSGWVVFLDRLGVGEQVANEFRQSGLRVVAVERGSEFRKIDDDSYAIHPSQPKDYDCLLKELGNDGEPIRQFLHCWCVENPEPGTARLDRLETVQALGFHSLLCLAQAIEKQAANPACDIVVVSTDVHHVTGDEQLLPEKATLLGPVKVIPQEFSGIACRNIDGSGLHARDVDLSQFVEQIIAELALEPAEGVVAYRGNQRWLQAVEPVWLANSATDVPRLRPGGTYLITGGLGGIGLTLARHLAESVKANLVLTSRSGLPHREQRSSNGSSGREASLERHIREIEDLGSQVLIAQADVANRDQMRDVLVQARERFGRIDGVIHAAGIADGALIARRTRATTDAVLSSKLQGTLVLQELFSDTKPDFLILCSALSSVLGGYGQVGYCAANAFLDAFAQEQSATAGTLTVAINWDAWREVGMAVETDSSSHSGDAPPHLDSWIPKQTPYDARLVRKHGIEYVARLSARDWFLDEHRIIGCPVLPGTAYIELARAAFEWQTGNQGAEIDEIHFLSPLIMESDEERELRTVLLAREDSFPRYEFHIVSHLDEEADRWFEHARGLIGGSAASLPAKLPLDELERAFLDEENVASAARPETGRVAIRLNSFGPRWQCVQQVRSSGREGLARLELSAQFEADLETYRLHPALVDMATGFMVLRDYREDELPASYERIRIHGLLPTRIVSYAREVGRNDQRGERSFEVTIAAEDGSPLIEIQRYTLRGTGRQRGASADAEMDATNGSASENFDLQIANPGVLSSLELRSAPRRPPGRDEVEIKVRATGLNFKDVLHALGLLAQDSSIPFPFGLECAGTVIAVGEGCREFAVGDAVIAFASSCFAAYTTTASSNVAPKPNTLTFEEAATVPVSFVTAYHSLLSLGKLSSDDRVLIQAAAGGVGLAAVAIAQWKGAEIFATAGSPEKREFLRSLGIEHVMDSRSLSFADEVLERTDGRGVDVVLNSLSGAFIEKGLHALAPFGRFLEIGVRDIANNTLLGLKPFEKCLTFISVGVGPELPNFTQLFRRIVTHIERSDFRPLPYTTYPLSRVADAFEYMAAAKHIGKIVVTQPEGDAAIQSARGAQHEPPSANWLRPPERWFALSSILGTEEDDDQTDGPAGSMSRPQAGGLSSSDAIEAFDRILGSGLPQVLVSTEDLTQRMQADYSLDAEESAAVSDRQEIHLRPDIETELVAPRNDTEATLAEIWGKLFGITGVGVHDNFFDLGGDSLLAAQAVSRIHREIHVALPLSRFLEQPTIADLSKQIDSLRRSMQDLQAAPVEALADDEEEGEI